MGRRLPFTAAVSRAERELLGGVWANTVRAPVHVEVPA
jgi:hypothetical protein